MPLRAIFDRASVVAPLYSETEWQHLRESARLDRTLLRMPCCDYPAVPKTSKRGTRYFAHRPGADCALAEGETLHHLHLKAAVLAALRQEAFSADIEVARDEWRADVLAQDGPESVAFEIQWSQQSVEDTLYRSRRYGQSGVRVVWLMRHPIAPELAERGDLLCVQVSEVADEYRITIGGRSLTVAEFIHLWAARNLHLGLRQFREWPTMEAHLFWTRCPACARATCVIAFAPAPLRTVCGLVLDEDVEVHVAARRAFAKKAAKDDVTFPWFHALPHYERRTPWRQQCVSCEVSLDDRWVRDQLAGELKRARPTAVVFDYQHEGTPSPSVPKHWCVTEDAGGCQATPDRYTAVRLAQSIAVRLHHDGIEAIVRQPSGRAGASRTDVCLLDVPALRLAVICTSRTLETCELDFWEARLGEARLLHFLSDCGEEPREGFDARLSLAWTLPFASRPETLGEVLRTGGGRWRVSWNGGTGNREQWLAHLFATAPVALRR